MTSTTRLPRVIYLSILMVLSAGVTPQNIRAQTTNTLELNPGTTAVQDIDKDGLKRFELSLGPNQLVQITIEKGDLRLAATLYEPGGRRVYEQQSHEFEPMSVVAVSQTSGKYRLEISSLEAGDGRRQFTLKVEDIRTATPRDLKSVAAYDSQARASVFRSKWEEKSLKDAVGKYKEASATWNSIGEERLAARALMDAAATQVILGEYREALVLFEDVAKQAFRISYSLAESEALSQMARLHSLLGRNDDALRYVTEAIAFYKNENNSDRSNTLRAHAEALISLGEVAYSKGDIVRASSSFAQALKMFSESGDRKGVARAQLFSGYIAGGLGDADTAAERISEALAIFKAVGDRSGEGSCMTALGLFYSFKRDDETGIRMHQDARQIFRDIGDRQSEAITFNGLGQAYEQLTEYKLALDYYVQAFDRFKNSETWDFAAVAAFQIAGAYRFLGDNNKALAAYEECLRISRLTKKTRTEANALKDVAALYAARGEPGKALPEYQKTLDFFRSIDDHRGLSIALCNLGDFLLAIGDPKKALSTYREALPQAERTGEKRVQIDILYGLARASRDTGLIDDAQSNIKRSVDLIEEVRDNLISPDFRTLYFSIVRKHYELYIDILMSLDRERPGQRFAAAALSISESARARSLVDLLIEARADIRQEANPQVIKREKELEALLRGEAQYQLEAQNTAPGPEEIAERTRQIDALRAEYQEIQAKVRDRNQRYSNLVQTRSITLPQIQHELSDGETLLLEYALGEEKSYLWVVSQQTLNTYVLPGRAVLEKTGREVYDALTARSSLNPKDPDYAQKVEAADQDYLKKARNLSQMLLGKAQPELGKNRLLVVTEGMLQYIPFEALPLPENSVGAPSTSGDSFSDVHYLIDSNEVITLPSMLTLAVIRRERGREPAYGKVVAVFADPVFDVDDDRVEVGNAANAVPTPTLKTNSVKTNQRLVHTAGEAQEILKEVPRRYALVATEFDATRERLMERGVEEFEILHLATHGVINAEQPELSGIVLGMVDRNGNRKEGFLTLNDIYRLSLSARLTVLSACETALGKNVQGEGLVGLTRGFMFAGSKSVAASLWKVDDRATSVLMGHFYKAMLHDGLSPAAALRFAKNEIKKEKAWRAPYFWAGFTLQGEYNQTITVPASFTPIYIALGFVILIASGGLLLIFRRRR